jgi:hypothetical protein
MRTSAILCLVTILACDPSETVETTKRTAEDVTDASRRAADATVEGTRQTIDGTKRAVDSVTEQANRAAALYEKLTDTGELSQSANAWLEARAKEQGGTMEQIIVKGTQVAPVALEVGRVLNRAVETDTAIEPIYQKVDGEGADLDAAIGSMPRVEVIEGLTVGIRQLDTLDTQTSVKERAYLVTWRQDDHLVGFVYRSTRTIDVDRLVTELPPLVRATRAALKTVQ